MSYKTVGLAVITAVVAALVIGLYRSHEAEPEWRVPEMVPTATKSAGTAFQSPP